MARILISFMIFYLKILFQSLYLKVFLCNCVVLLLLLLSLLAFPYTHMNPSDTITVGSSNSPAASNITNCSSTIATSSFGSGKLLVSISKSIKTLQNGVYSVPWSSFPRFFFAFSRVHAMVVFIHSACFGGRGVTQIFQKRVISHTEVLADTNMRECRRQRRQNSNEQWNHSFTPTFFPEGVSEFCPCTETRTVWDIKAYFVVITRRLCNQLHTSSPCISTDDKC